MSIKFLVGRRFGRLALAVIAAALGLTPAALAGATTPTPGTTVFVRVEGRYRTLLAPTEVTVHGGSVTKDGAPKGACSARSGAGALNDATHGDWSGTWSPSYNDYFMTRILGDYEGGRYHYWEIFLNHVAASSGACGITLHRGDRLLFAVVPSTGPAWYPLGEGAPQKAVVGKAFKVHVVWYDAKGIAHPAAYAHVDGKLTNRYGNVWITPQHTGALIVQAWKRATKTRAFVRAQPLRVTVV